MSKLAPMRPVQVRVPLQQLYGKVLGDFRNRLDELPTEELLGLNGAEFSSNFAASRTVDPLGIQIDMDKDVVGELVDPASNSTQLRMTVTLPVDYPDLVAYLQAQPSTYLGEPDLSVSDTGQIIFEVRSPTDVASAISALNQNIRTRDREFRGWKNALPDELFKIFDDVHAKREAERQARDAVLADAPFPIIRPTTEPAQEPAMRARPLRERVRTRPQQLHQLEPGTSSRTMISTRKRWRSSTGSSLRSTASSTTQRSISEPMVNLS